MKETPDLDVLAVYPNPSDGNQRKSDGHRRLQEEESRRGRRPGEMRTNAVLGLSPPSSFGHPPRATAATARGVVAVWAR
jgi:hypothetical protein